MDTASQILGTNSALDLNSNSQHLSVELSFVLTLSVNQPEPPHKSVPDIKEQKDGNGIWKR